MMKMDLLFILIVLVSASNAARRPSKCQIPPEFQMTPEQCPPCLNYVIERGCMTCKCVGNPEKWDDIKLDRQTTSNLKYLIGEKNSRASYKSVTKWNNIPSGNYYDIPYVLDSSLTSLAVTAINAAIVDMEANTCLRFILRTSEADYVNFRGDESGCWSYVGRIRGAQTVSIPSGCDNKGTVIHEIMHVIGFFHEHSRSDRNKYIKILFGNVESDMRHNFQKFTRSELNYYKSPYDRTSIMHYSKTAFNTNGQDTIINKDGSTFTDYQRTAMSESDIYQINRMYKCKAMIVCLDYRSDCAERGTNGLCTTRKGLMRKLCPKTCGFC